MYYIAHGGYVSDPAWLKSQGFGAAGNVVCDASIPNPSAIRNAGLAAHINPYNDGNCGLDHGCDGSGSSSWWQAAKNAGYSMIAGEGVLTSITNAGQQILPYLNYCGDIGGVQWDVTQSNPRGMVSWGGQGQYVVPETYVQGNVMNLGSCQSVALHAINAGAKGIGILISNWPYVYQNGGVWVNFIKSFPAAVQSKMAVLFWVGCGYDICASLKSGTQAEPFQTLKANFPPSATWGGASPSPTPPAPVHPHAPIYELLFD